MNFFARPNRSRGILFNKESRKIEIFIPWDCKPSNRKDGCYKATICYVIAQKENRYERDEILPPRWRSTRKIICLSLESLLSSDKWKHWFSSERKSVKLWNPLFNSFALRCLAWSRKLNLPSETCWKTNLDRNKKETRKQKQLILEIKFLLGFTIPINFCVGENCFTSFGDAGRLIGFKVACKSSNVLWKLRRFAIYRLKPQKVSESYSLDWAWR